ncbi:MAG TPA: DUF4446 family protein [Candidatus Limnocylindrales bacterium]|nr:DUF4446 family protein [Candidatus Limnocylindrales bacterium]
MEAPTIDLDALAAEPVAPIVLAVSIVAALLLLAVLALALRVRRLSRRLERLTRGTHSESLEAVLDAHLQDVSRVSRELDEVEARAAQIESALRQSFQRVALVRYNPFEDTGGNQSFALALLDGNADGVVLSSLHARAGTRVYAKTLTRGRSDSPLSDEEAEALRRAVSPLEAAAGRR